MVGIVIVSHSTTLAGGVRELAAEMSGPDVRIELAGGVEAPEPALGTDAVRVAEAPEIPTGSSGDPEAEWRALRDALEQVRGEIEAARDSIAARAGEYSAAIFDAHLLFLDDEALLGPVHRAIFEEGRNAAEAWHAATEAVAADYRSLDDEYMQARADDLTGVARQVVAALTGAAAVPSVAAPGIVVAADLTPADTAALDRELALGIATAAGSPTSHSAILARSLGIPAAVGLGAALLRAPEGTPLLLDGDAGLVYVEPVEELTDEYERRAAAGEQARLAARAAAHEPAVTRDGREIEGVANIGSPDDVPAAIENGAEGVGLLRTEFLFLERASRPRLRVSWPSGPSSSLPRPRSERCSRTRRPRRSRRDRQDDGTEIGAPCAHMRAHPCGARGHGPDPGRTRPRIRLHRRLDRVRDRSLDRFRGRVPRASLGGHDEARLVPRHHGRQAPCHGSADRARRRQPRFALDRGDHHRTRAADPRPPRCRRRRWNRLPTFDLGQAEDERSVPGDLPRDRSLGGFARRASSRRVGNGRRRRNHGDLGRRVPRPFLRVALGGRPVNRR